jgi:hypothetical protein
VEGGNTLHTFPNKDDGFLMSHVIAGDRLYCNWCLKFRPESDFSMQARAQARAGDDRAACQPCVDRLYYSAIGRSEMDSYLAEDKNRRLDKYRIPDQEDRKASRGRWGRAMQSSELILKIARIAPSVFPMDGRIEGDISLIRRRPSGYVDYIAYTNSGLLPEYSIVVVNEDNLPLHELRGWRTVLLRLIKAGVVTEEQVNKEFGLPSDGEISRFWREELKRFRDQQFNRAA